jgi:selenocysteine lyase/cysteine desulfurase
MPGWEPSPLVAELRSQNIHTSVASRSSALIDFRKKGVSWALRLSPHYYNTEAEIEEAAKALQRLARS